ncbi:MAG: M14 family metallopeptidase [Leptolyngbyaceae cyanobacterium MO_188.B28]|nr:M14 family metallopeptidase [Leptolyngbyaceae cyanobacterium MO_188.B28]
MPPNGYLSVTGIASAQQYLVATYSSICQLIPLPEASIEGRTIRGLKIAGGEGGDRRGVLLIAGIHARELINPDLLVWFALKLCQAYTANSGLTFGARTYDASSIQLLVNELDLFLLPLANPDGRAFVQLPKGYAMWRKNRNPNPGMPCMGVDLNRNFDFLWSSGIGTSPDSCSDIFKGLGAFSEPEILNVRHFLDTYPNIGYFADVHSYSELILYPWGDDDNQTIDPAMNFQNPTYDGLRGTPGDSLYREYIPQSDLDWYVSTGNRVRDAIAAVRGHTYTVQQAVGLYPTTGTSEDYVYTRHFVDSSKGKVRGFVIETGTEFQPPYSEALRVIEEVSAGLVEFCLACQRTVEETLRGGAASAAR